MEGPIISMIERRPRVGVSSTVIQNGKVLLGKRLGSHGEKMWATPGGHLEYGESAQGCAKRELYEETGLLASSMQIGPYTNDLIEPEGKHYITLFIFITDFEGILSCREPQKCEGWEWFDWDNLPSPLFTPVSSLISIYTIENLKKLSITQNC